MHFTIRSKRSSWLLYFQNVAQETHILVDKILVQISAFWQLGDQFTSIVVLKSHIICFSIRNSQVTQR